MGRTRGVPRLSVALLPAKTGGWRAILELRREQLEAWKAAQPQQPVLFELKTDTRPAVERTAAGRYREPTLMTYLQERE